MNVFIINLDKNVERMSSIKAQLDRIGLAYERFPAVFGKLLTKQEKKVHFSARRSFLAMGTCLTDGEIGCALSHAMIYRKMCENEIPTALILEDDIILNDNFHDILKMAIEFLDSNKPQVILFSSYGCIQKDQDGIERIKGGMCTDGYLITRPAARMLYMANYPVITVADSWDRWVKRYGLELYRIWPTAVWQNNEKFGTDVNTVHRTQKNIILKILRKFIRLPEVIIDWILFVFTHR